MYSIVNLIIKVFQKYNNIYNLYTQEFINDISIFQFYNALILLFILCFIFINFFIKKYTFKKVVIFFLTRFFFSMFFLLFFYLASNFTICETTINKNIGQHITNDKIKYICIATITITGCCIGYKYIPILYNNLKTYNDYKNSLIKKKEYDLKYQLYLESLNKKDILNLKHSKDVEEYNLGCEKFNAVLQHFLTNNNVIKDQYLNFCYNLKLLKINNFLFNFNSVNGISNFNYNINLQNFINNYDKIQDLLYSLKMSNNSYMIDQQLLFMNQIKLFNDIVSLFNFYERELIPFQKKFLNKNGELINLNLLSDLNFTNHVFSLGKNLNTYLDNVVSSSNNVLICSEQIFNLPLLNKPQDLDFTSIIIKKPEVIKPVDFSLENLEGFKFIGLNISYIFFYPLLYCSNKILGTVNPLSKNLFYDACKNLIFWNIW